MTDCRRADDGYMLASHQPTCNDRACRGCVPCLAEKGNPVRHCGIRRRCTSHLETSEHACPGCLSKIRGNMATICARFALMLDEAIEAGLDSEAASLAGPSANLIYASWRKVNALAAGEPVDEWDMNDPYTVLAMREREIRVTLGHDTSTPVSEHLYGVTSYLSWVLTDLARHEDHVPTLVDLMAETGRLRAHLEAVLHDSSTPERGAPCPKCSTPDEKGPALTKRYATWDVTGAHDTWRCPDEDDHVWSEADYRLRVGGDYLAHSDKLTASQIHQAHGIRPGSVTGWAAKGKVSKRGRDQHGRQLYDVDDARRMAGQLEDVGA